MDGLWLRRKGARVVVVHGKKDEARRQRLACGDDGGVNQRAGRGNNNGARRPATKNTTRTSRNLLVGRREMRQAKLC